MINQAKRLKSIAKNNRQSYVIGRKERVHVNRLLDENELKAVSEILGRTYNYARYIEHSLYLNNRGTDLSIIFGRNEDYSEAFAGSGELAAVATVVKVLNAPEYSLILLDEPETSLHPGAQKALLLFLLSEIKKKKHQIIVSTHSPEFLSGLPHSAIKVLEDNGLGSTRVLPSSSPNAALARLGKLPENNIRILVEDRLAQLLVFRALRCIDQGDAQTVEVKVAPGGASAILAHLGPAAMTSGDDVYLLLDGDQKKVEQFLDSQSIAPVNYPKVYNLLSDQLGVEPVLNIPGGDDSQGHYQAKLEQSLQYLDWTRERLAYLPKLVPEITILSAINPGKDYSNVTSQEAKEKFKQEFEVNGVDLTAEELVTFGRVKIASIPDDNEDIQEIVEQIKKWLHN